MSDVAILAFVVAPATVVLLGYTAMRLQERETARLKREIEAKGVRRAVEG